MLSLGFLDDVEWILRQAPAGRQTLLFSATMPPAIRQLADTWLRDPVVVRVAAESAPAENVSQSVFLVDQRHKPQLLVHWLKRTGTTRALVFTRTKHGADKVAKHLVKSGIRAEAIHGNKSQAARERALRSFKSQHPPVLVATDVASRGLDIDDVSHVVNFDLPMVPEIYVHRIGRTGRAGASGIAVSFCDGGERSQLRAIERLTRQTLSIEKDQPVYAGQPPVANAPAAKRPEADRPHGKRPPHQHGGGQSRGKHAGGEKRAAKRRTAHAGR